MKTIAEQIVAFYKSLKPPKQLPAGFDWLYPQKDSQVISIVEKFFNKYYNDDNPRTLIFGINPGRFGAGVTGINFTGPRQLKNECGIEHPFKDHSELSAEFIYEMINTFGGPEKFYSKFFVTAISPLGFIKNGININYYDDPKLFEIVKPFLVSSIKDQVSMNISRDVAYCIGGDKNLKYFKQINDEHKLFNEIIPLPHPRFIMQYRRKKKQDYVEEYIKKLSPQRSAE
jgi:hypothetical protein